VWRFRLRLFGLTHNDGSGRKRFCIVSPTPRMDPFPWQPILVIVNEPGPDLGDLDHALMCGESRLLPHRHPSLLDHASILLVVLLGVRIRICGCKIREAAQCGGYQEAPGRF
jgi:hypothetical protein